MLKVANFASKPQEWRFSEICTSDVSYEQTSTQTPFGSSGSLVIDLIPSQKRSIENNFPPDGLQMCWLSALGAEKFNNWGFGFSEFHDKLLKFQYT